MEHNQTLKRFLLGVAIVLAGLAFLLSNMGVLEFEIKKYLLRWEMIIILIGLVSILSHGNKAPGIIILMVGGALYLRDFLDIHFNFWQVFWPGILILAGVMIILRKKFETDNFDKKGLNSEDIIDDVAVFGGGDKIVMSQNFRGGKILAVFGGSNFNMVRAKLAPGKQYIDVLAIFGGTKLIVPENWNVKIDVISIFGGFSDKHRLQPYTTETQPSSELVIKGFVLFGGGDIRSF